ncbi:MAG: dihydroxyacetone kinase transcriptional activator DhaS [Bacillota bacterium]|nr:dihydroxyacetone kinase transcriptional activator DhaS [Bacillota bacterium]
MSNSIITKKALSTALKELMKRKSFDRITVEDITNQCGLNRQTFYYHFQDKYDLINWIYYNEAIAILSQDLTYDNWNDRILELLTVMKSESYFYQNTFKSSGENEFENYLLSFTRELFISIIKNIDENNAVSEEDVNFFSQFFSFGSVGMIVSWAKTGMTASPESIVYHLKNLAYYIRQFALKLHSDEADQN